MHIVGKNKENDVNGKARRAGRLHLAATAAIMVLIFVHSAMPADMSSAESGILVGLLFRLFEGDPERTSFFVRKCAHFTEYLVLGFSLGFTVDDFVGMPETGGGKAKSLSLAWGIGALYACTDEFHQRFVSGRSPELRDVGIDFCGACLGIGIYFAGAAIHKRIQIHRKKSEPQTE